MRTVHLIYRSEAPGWVASSPEAPDYVAYASDLREAIKLAHEGIAFHFDVPQTDLQIIDSVGATPSIVAANNVGTVSGVFSTVSGAGAQAAAVNIGEGHVPSMAPSSVREAKVQVETLSAV